MLVVVMDKHTGSTTSVTIDRQCQRTKLITIAKRKLGISSGIYRSLWYNGKPMAISPIMKAIPKEDDKPGSPPVLTLSSTIPEDFQ